MPTPVVVPQREKRKFEENYQPAKRACIKVENKPTPIDHYLLAHPDRKHRMALIRLTLERVPIFYLKADGAVGLLPTEEDLLQIVPWDEMREYVIKTTLSAPPDCCACLMDDTRFHHELAFGFFRANLKSIPTETIDAYLVHLRGMVVTPEGETAN